MKKYQQGSVRIGQIQKSDKNGLSIRISLLIILCLMMIQVAIAQSGMSVLRGTVVDQTGAAIAGVTITLTEPSTGLTIRTLVSGNNGDYEIPGVKPGIYKVKAEKNGFKLATVDEILLESGQTRRVDITLNVGGAQEEVTVSAGAATINTENGTLNSGFDSRKFANTPLVDVYPSPLAMFATLPGVQGNGWDLRISGQGASQQSIGLDGVNNDRTGEQINNMNFYEEASITTVNAGANSSRLGSYNLVSKRGNNDFHGMMYYKHFNSALNARTFREDRKTPFIQHEWQAEISGPIFKNRTHFYFAWFQQRIPLGSFNVATVPTDKMRAGDFSEITDEIINPFTGEAFAGNKIPTNLLNPVSMKAQELYYPKANRSDNGFSRNYQWVHPYNSDFYLGDWPFFRIDHQITSNNSIFGKWHQRKTPYVLVSGLPDFYWTRLRDHRQTVITDTHTFSPSLVNVFRFGLSTDYIVDGEETDGQKPIQGDEAVSAIGLKGVNPSDYKGAGFPYMEISGGDLDPADLSAVTGGVKNNDKSFTFGNDITWQKGNHIWKFGAEYNKFSTFFGENPNYGSFYFDGRYTNNGYADFLLGLPYSSSRTDPLVNRRRNNKEVGLYVMDTFKVTPNLTLDFGLRWDYYAIPTYEDGMMYNFIPETSKILVDSAMIDKINSRYPNKASVISGKVSSTADKKNFRPRFSAAYRFNNDFVIRGGYGQFTERYGRGYFELVSGAGPFARFSESYENKFVAGTPDYMFPNPFPSSNTGVKSVGTQSVSAFPEKWNSGTIHQYNLSIEKEVKKIGLRASYIGSRGQGLSFSYGANVPKASTMEYSSSRKPFPQFSGVTFFSNEGKSKFNSIQVEAQRKMGWYTFDAHYTLSSNLNNINVAGDPYDLTSQWANDSATRRHMAVVTTTWELPFGKGKNFLNQMPRVVDAVLGGWQIQTISTFGSGTYFTPYFCKGGVDVAGTNTTCGRPDLIGDPKLSGDQKTIDNWFNTDAFAIPGCPSFDPMCKTKAGLNAWIRPGRRGNAGANILEGQGLNVHHLSLTKKFRLNERWSFTFTSSISNLFNRAHFYNPDGSINEDGGTQLYWPMDDFVPEKNGHRVISFKGRLNF